MSTASTQACHFSTEAPWAKYKMVNKRLLIGLGTGPLHVLAGPRSTPPPLGCGSCAFSYRNGSWTCYYASSSTGPRGLPRQGRHLLSLFLGEAIVLALYRRGHPVLSGLGSPRPRDSLPRQRFRKCTAPACPSGVPCLCLATALCHLRTAGQPLGPFFLRATWFNLHVPGRACTCDRPCPCFGRCGCGHVTREYIGGLRGDSWAG